MQPDAEQAALDLARYWRGGRCRQCNKQTKLKGTLCQSCTRRRLWQRGAYNGRRTAA